MPTPPSAATIEQPTHKGGINTFVHLDNVRFGFRNQPEFLGPISLSVDHGQCWAIVGPNGAGKSTLLRLIAGLHRPNWGNAFLGGQDVTTLPRRARAKQIAFVPQNPPSDLELTVREVVLLGRFPHRSLGLFESATDGEAVERTMVLTETSAFAERPLSTLSGGEVQRVHLAAALAQEPALLLLDEPTTSLDIQHQMAVFQILRRLARVNGLTVIVVTHDVNLAAQFCSHVLLLNEGRAAASGLPADVLTPERLNPVYSVKLMALTDPSTPSKQWLVCAADDREEFSSSC